MKAFAQSEKASRGRVSAANEAECLLAKQSDATVSSLRGTPENRLDSWKEIASYLGREVRTAQRWEEREGLPVHRHIHNKAGSVYAFKTEIDEWRKSRLPNPSALVSQRNDPSPVRDTRMPRRQAENLPIALYRADQSLWKGEEGDILPVIIYVAPGLVTPHNELKSLCLGNLLAIGTARKFKRVSGLATSRETTQGDRR